MCRVLCLTLPLRIPPCPRPAPQLNPGAVLNHKYTGENAVRASGLSYCVLRPTGLTNESEPGEFLLEASQGEGSGRGWGRGRLCCCLTA